MVTAKFSKEYGTGESLEVQWGSIKPGDVVIVIDDLLATGGTLAAACEMVRGLGAKVGEAIVVIELEGLGGRAKLTQSNVPVWSLFSFPAA